MQKYAYLDELYVNKRVGPNQQRVDCCANKSHHYDQRLVTSQVRNEEDDRKIREITVDRNGVHLLLHRLLREIPPRPRKVFIDEGLRGSYLLEEPEDAEEQRHLEPALHFAPAPRVNRIN